MNNLIKLFIKYSYWNSPNPIKIRFYESEVNYKLLSGGLDYFKAKKIELYNKKNEFISIRSCPNPIKIEELIRKYINE